MMELSRVAEMLDEYRHNRDAKHAEHGAEIARTIVAHAPQMPTDAVAALYDSAFQLLWQQQTDYRQAQIDIRRQLIDPLLAAFPKVPPRPRKAAPERFVYLCPQLHVKGPYANARNTHSLLRGVPNPSQWSLYIYGPADQSVVADLASRGVDIWQFEGGAERKITEMMGAIADQGADVVLSDMYWFTPLALYALRAAPCFLYLSHGFQMMPADGVILPDTQVPFGQVAATIPYTLDRFYLAPPLAPCEKVAPLVFATLARHEKISAPFRAAAAAILDRHPQAVYLLYGAGSVEAWHPRVRVMGVAAPRHVLAGVDVFLDTWPLCGCMAVMEAQAQGVPAVSLSHPATASYDRFKAGVVATEADYHALVDKLATDPVERAARALEGRRLVAGIMDVERGGQALMEAIRWHWTHTQT